MCGHVWLGIWIFVMKSRDTWGGWNPDSWLNHDHQFILKGGRGGHQKDYTLITDYRLHGGGGRETSLYKKREDQLWQVILTQSILVYIIKIHLRTDYSTFFYIPHTTFLTIVDISNQFYKSKRSKNGITQLIYSPLVTSITRDKENWVEQPPPLYPLFQMN